MKYGQQLQSRVSIASSASTITSIDALKSVEIPLKPITMTESSFVPAEIAVTTANAVPHKRMIFHSFFCVNREYFISKYLKKTQSM